MEKNSLIGKEETALNHLEERHRTVSRDGKPYIITDDYDAERLNIYIEDGTIVKVTYG